MPARSVRLLSVLALSAAYLGADVTIRYKTEMKSGVNAPMPAPAAHDIYMKGNQGATTDGEQTTIVDFVKQEITLVDTGRKKFATIPASQYGDAIAKMVPQMNMAGITPESLKSKVDSKKTGRTETILGVLTEETETNLSMDIPMPPGTPATGMKGMGMKMVMQAWNAAPAETMRVPAIHQLTGFNLWQSYFMNGAQMVARMLPGAGPDLVEALKGQNAVMRSSMKMFMVMPGMDSDSPMMEMTTEIVSLSTDPVDDSVFRIPAGFTSTSFSELLNDRVQDAVESAKSRKAPAAAASAPVAGDLQAYVPDLMPLTQTTPEIPEEAKSAGVQGTVQLLVTLDAQGHVAKAEALSGPEVLRKYAVKEVASWTWRPVIRNGAAVSAGTNATIYYMDWSKGPGAANQSMTELMESHNRLDQLEQAYPRTPAQVLADLEQDSQGGDKTRRFYALNRMTKAALDAGADEKADRYAHELLAMAKEFPKDWNYGNAVYDGHAALGLLALKKDDLTAAGRELVEAGKTSGSPQLNSFGPSMRLASELLAKGQKAAVLEYFSECRSFWKMGTGQLDSWTEAVNQGETPAWGMSLR